MIIVRFRIHTFVGRLFARVLTLSAVFLASGLIGVAPAASLPSDECLGDICGDLSERAIIISGDIRRNGKQQRTKAKPGITVDRSTGSGGFEFVRSQVCGGP